MSDENGPAPGSGFNYDEPAELFGGGSWSGKRTTLAYQRFDSAAEAIRYIMEELDEAARRPCVLEVNEKRLTHVDVRRLYDSKHYPLERKAGKDDDGT